MATKSKKGSKMTELTSEITSTIAMIKCKWPEYPVNAEHLKKPSREFVLKFYEDCIKSYLQMLAFATRREDDGPPMYPQHLSVEDILHINLIQHIPSLQEYGFKLGDLFIFDPIRTVTFFKITIHYLTFVDSAIAEVLEVIDDIHNKHDQAEHKKKQLENLKEELNAKYAAYAQLKEGKEKLEKELEGIAGEFDKIIGIKKEKDKVYEEKDRELEKVKEEIDYVENKNTSHEQKVAVLKDQIVTEEEFESLKCTVENEKKEEQSLEEEELDIVSGLQEHKTAITHIETCLTELKIDLKTSHYSNPASNKCSKLRQDLQNTQQKYQYALNKTRGMSESDLQKEVGSLERKIMDLEKDTKRLYEAHLLSKENFVSEEKKLNDSKLKLSEQNRGELEELRKAINHQKAEIESLEVGFDEKQNNMKKVLEQVILRTQSYFDRFSVRSGGN